MQVAGRVQGTGEEMGGNWTTIIAKSIKILIKNKVKLNVDSLLIYILT